ncbi:hypothetical protein [Streptomyces sp. H39-C1]|uniref:hypothetical protein n=1 Tax=Streptomyces sp. H39-C1 TaxID=3004355 RepID=UPI0022AFE99E|nr:hypothetical protein [Streptomyces sp. H39-C1]MCZ4098306.1 hypothetical protein [Streptomyces sp. H39-C1]
MTLVQPPMLTHGGTHPARAFRMMIRDLARGSQGITEGNNLKVRQLATPGAAVRVGDGSSVIRGAAWGQGSYTQYNVGDAVVPIAPTGASSRSDLLIQRVEDPEYEGNRNPATDDIGYFQVLPNVSATTVTAPAGMTAIVLARIDIPANTATITDSMVRDLRQIANPRRTRELFTAFPGALDRLTSHDDRWHNWPAAARWNIAVPEWAVNTKILTTVSTLRMDTSFAFAYMQNVFGTIQGQDTTIDDDQGTGIRRSTVIMADNLTLDPVMRGTVQPLYLQTYTSPRAAGNFGVDGGTSLICDIEFTEGVI